MKKFYLKIFLFVTFIAMILVMCEYLSVREPFRTWIAEWTDSESFITGNVGADEIKPYISKVQTSDETTKLLLGDSVGRQLYVGLQEYNEDVAIVGSNAAITMAGQYILAAEYIENHPEATDIFLVVLPESLCRTFDTKWGYQYTVMPFVETGTLDRLDQDTVDIMESVYGEFFMQEDIVYKIDRSAINRKLYLNMLKEHSDSYNPENKFALAEQYLMKMYELCNANDVNMHLYAGPLADNRVQEIEVMKREYEETELYQIFPDFMDNIYFYPVEQAADGVHFSGDYANQEFYNELIKKMYTGTALGEAVKLY